MKEILMNLMKNIKLNAVMLLVLPCMIMAGENYTQSLYYKELSDVKKLNYAIEECDIENIRYLLTKVDVNSKDNRGCTILQNAIVDGKLEVIQLLVESGADVNALDNEGFTALDSILLNLTEGIGMCYADGMEFMIEQGYFEEYILIAQYLVEMGTDLTLKHHVLNDLEGLDLNNVPSEFMNALSDHEKEAFIIISRPMNLLEIVTYSKNEYVYFMNSNTNIDDRGKEALQSLLNYLNKFQNVLEQAA